MTITVVWCLHLPHSPAPQKVLHCKLHHLQLCIRALLCISHLPLHLACKQDLRPICFLLCDGWDHCFIPSIMKKWQRSLQGMGWQAKLGELKKCPELLFPCFKPSGGCSYTAKPFWRDENRIHRQPGPCSFSRSSSYYGHSFFWIALPQSASTT